LGKFTFARLREIRRADLEQAENCDRVCRLALRFLGLIKSLADMDALIAVITALTV
jgi:hypothetical protein